MYKYDNINVTYNTPYDGLCVSFIYIERPYIIEVALYPYNDESYAIIINVTTSRLIVE